MTDAPTRRIEIEDIVSQPSVSDVRISPDGSVVVYSLGWASKTDEHPIADLWLAATDGSWRRQLTAGRSNDVQPCWSPDGRLIAFISDREARGAPYDPERGATGALFVIAPDGGEAVRVSATDMELMKPQWAPDGRALSVLGLDPPTDAERHRLHARDDVFVHGENEKFIRLYRIDLPDDPFESSQCPCTEPHRILDGQWHVWDQRWSPAGDFIAVTIAPRPGADELFDGVRLALVPATGGQPIFIAGAQGSYRWATSPAWSPSGHRLAFLGGFDLRYDSGEAIYIADPADPSTAKLRYQDDEGTLLSVGWLNDEVLLTERLVSTHVSVWSLGLEHGEPQQALPAPLGERGTTGGLFAYDVRGSIDRAGRSFAIVWGDATHPPEVWGGSLGQADGIARRLTHVNAGLESCALGRHELVRWRAADGLEIEGQIIFPVGYQAGRRYPTIVNIHGGPSWTWDDHFYANWYDWGQLLAGRGYLVFLPIPRGSTGRGWRFQIANLHDWMGGEYTDSEAGVDELITRGLADPDRLGIGGWSYGGYTAAWAVTQTDRYKAAVVLNGVTNRVSSVNTTDNARRLESRFRSPYAEDPDEYWDRSPMRYVGRVTTPTLFLFGGNERRVPVSQGWEMYNALRRMGVPAQIAIYPREPHEITERQHQRDLLERMLAWFGEYVM